MVDLPKTRASHILGIGLILLAGCGGATVWEREGAAASADGGGGSGSPAGGGSAAPTNPGTSPPPVTCPAPPQRNDFETALDPAWKVTDESAFRLDRDNPLAGTQSLRLAYRQRDSHLSIPMPNVCAVRLAFTFRADARLVGSEVTIARVSSGVRLVAPALFFHVRLGSQGLTVSQEIFTTGGAGGIGFGPPVATVAADVPTAVVLTVDFRSLTWSAAVGPAGSTLPPPKTTPFRMPETGATPTGITSVEIGSAPGVQSAGLGILWIDDLSIE